ncbi:MAG TPA: hypothetical protein VH206_18125 [Xanthobacteraceae bacterium]|nr:hypothetical protein [Xanthobacteraceae bacterium]
MNSSDQKQSLTEKSKFVAIAVIMVFGSSQQAFSQALDLRDGTANPQPVVFDSGGGKHPCLYGYYGPPVPLIKDASAHLLAVSRQDTSSPQGFGSFLALQFSSIVGTCQRK